MDLQDLEKIGLTSGELKLYEALLNHGELTRTDLAKYSSISPSKIYDVANRLLEKGIISSVKKNNVLHFSATNPNKLLDYTKQKKAEIDQEEALITTLMPTLLGKYQQNQEKTDVEVFYGWDGMKTAYNDIVNTLGKDDTNYIFGASAGQNSSQSDIFFSQYYQKVTRKGYAVNIIFNEEIRNNEQRIGIYANKPHEVKFLHSNTLAEVNIYKNTVLFILLLQKPIIIRLKSKEAADSYKDFFETLWKSAKE